MITCERHTVRCRTVHVFWWTLGGVHCHNREDSFVTWIPDIWSSTVKSLSILHLSYNIKKINRSTMFCTKIDTTGPSKVFCRMSKICMCDNLTRMLCPVSSNSSHIYIFWKTRDMPLNRHPLRFKNHFLRELKSFRDFQS